MTMPVECVSGDFSDPEAVSGSSTSLRVRIAYLGDFLLLIASVLVVLVDQVELVDTVDRVEHVGQVALVDTVNQVNLINLVNCINEGYAWHCSAKVLDYPKKAKINPAKSILAGQ